MINFKENICYDSILKNELKQLLLKCSNHDYRIYRTIDIESIISSFYGVNKENIMLGYGIEDLIDYFLSSFFMNKKINIISPTWFLMRKRCEARNVKFEENGEGDILYIANPNGITGELISIDNIIDYSKKYEYIFLDEAYGEYANQSFVNYLNDYPNVIVLKSFTKSLSSPGMRFGYAFCDPKFKTKDYAVRHNQFISPILPELLSMIEPHIKRMKETKKNLESMYEHKNTHANFVLMSNLPGWIKNNFIYKPPYIENLYRVTLFDMKTFERYYS